MDERTKRILMFWAVVIYFHLVGIFTGYMIWGR